MVFEDYKKIRVFMRSCPVVVYFEYEEYIVEELKIDYPYDKVSKYPDIMITIKKSDSYPEGIPNYLLTTNWYNLYQDLSFYKSNTYEFMFEDL